MGAIQRERAALQLITSPLYYHSDGDTPANVPPAGLEAVARAYSKIIDEVGKMSRAEIQPAPPSTSTRSGAR